VLTLDVFGSFAPSDGPTWLDLDRELREAGIGHITFSTAMRGLSEAEVPGYLGYIILRVSKPNTETTFYAYTTDGLARLLAEEPVRLAARKILVGEHFEAFSTVKCAFAEWEHRVADEERPEDVETTTPQAIVRSVNSTSATAIVPSRIGPLLLVGEPPRESPTFAMWRAYALSALPLALVNEIRRDPSGTTLVVRGVRRVEIRFGPPARSPNALLCCELAAARWIYGGAGAENRHTLFTSELSRAWNDGDDWGAAFSRVEPRVLEAATSAYELLLSGKTNDVLKAQADLRKALLDEVAKITTQTRDLLSSLWRDFAVAVAALVARATIADAAKPGIRLLLLGVAVFLTYSLWVTVTSSAAFIRLGHDSRRAWNDRLYAFLSGGEFAALATKPIDETEEVYRRTVGKVLAAYAVLVGVITLSAIWQDGWSAAVQNCVTRACSSKTIPTTGSPAARATTEQTKGAARRP
jgi:hypothetical protein